MPRLRCLTITAKEPNRLAEFYREVFELETVSESDLLVRLSDGVFTLALLKLEDDRHRGLHASGFEVENLEDVEKRVEHSDKASAPYSERQVADPDGNLVDLSRRSFGASMPPAYAACALLSCRTSRAKRRRPMSSNASPKRFSR